MHTWWNVDKIQDQCDYIVFYNINFENLCGLANILWKVGPVLKQEKHLSAFLGAQQEFEVTSKYKVKCTICNWGKPCIWLNNKGPREGQPDWKVDWFNTNSVVYHLDHPLYSEEPANTPTPTPLVPSLPTTPRPRTPLFLPSPSPLCQRTPTPPPPPHQPAADTYRAYIDKAHKTISNMLYQGGQAQLIRYVEDHTELLHTRVAFRGEDTIQRDPMTWMAKWDGYLEELNRLLGMEI